MLVKDAKPGTIIETIYQNVASGNCYKITTVAVLNSRKIVKARKRFTGESINLHPENMCRVIDPTTIDGF